MYNLVFSDRRHRFSEENLEAFVFLYYNTFLINILCHYILMPLFAGLVLLFSNKIDIFNHLSF